ncbi:hypothetical protein L6164_031295 [Bauhinia variegata]|uniref:Uncharacterized protein n=1 Tax=Bauhinia variegata TaxID=167791 RepID=A0ACB9LFB8_BAUVA|nr:hypothetical protein L6164_031295 [Bauhinia variegata]
MFPEDDEIEVEDLVRFGKGLRQAKWAIGRMEKARREVYVALNNLLDSYLLLHTGKRNSVKMHDMVHEVALWIACEEDQAVMVDIATDEGLLHEEETVQAKVGICLWNLEEFSTP